jgi:CHAT domain-containing protein/tetratricopeptide (TPR) repeat protein
MRFAIVAVLLLTPRMWADDLSPQERQKLEDESKKLNVEGARFLQQGQAAKALAKYQQAYEIRQKLFPASAFPDGHFLLANSLFNLGLAARHMPDFERSLQYFEQALAMRKKLYPEKRFLDGHYDVAAALNGIGGALLDLGSLDKAMTNFEQALAIFRELYPVEKFPDGHSDISGCLLNMGITCMWMGSREKAAQFFEQSLAMNVKLFSETKFPNGHLQLSNNLTFLGMTFYELRSYEKAKSYFERALAMNQNLFPATALPQGHPILANNLSHVGSTLYCLREYEKSRTFYEQSLAMLEKLFPESDSPEGQPDVANALRNLGMVLRALGDAAKELPYLERAFAVHKKFYPVDKYPDGHSQIVGDLHSLGRSYLANGSPDKAFDTLEQAVRMQRKLVYRQIALASEYQAFALLRNQPGIEHDFLSVASGRPEFAARSYDVIWNSKNTMMKLMGQRHRAALVQVEHSPEIKGNYEKLVTVRRQMGNLLQNPDPNSAVFNSKLIELTDELDHLERDLAKLVPTIERSKAGQLQPHDLLAALPHDTVFIDFVYYDRIENDKNVGGRFLAFILAPKQQVQIVQLGMVSTIEADIINWFDAISRRKQSEAVLRLRRFLWDQLAAHFPPDTHTVYISPAGSLARIPWAALPGRQPNTVLLEEFSGGIAVVPDGSFLLEQLKKGPTNNVPDTLLTLGGLDYGSTNWPVLPGTSAEVATLQRLAPKAVKTLDKSAASGKSLCDALTKASFAHLATHGYFAAEEMITEQQKELAARHQPSLSDSALRPIPIKNTMAFTGIVLSGGEILNSLALIDLPLENLKLVTLSACETGLGEATGGEGVFGPVRAFHLAGCPNVVASLWNVNDAATAALMAKFYHELWINKKPPIAALREAQLTIYYHPELIPDLAGERGAPKLKEAVAVNSGRTPDVSPGVKRADTKLWAAFVLSGVGK